MGFDRRKEPDTEDFVIGPNGKPDQYRGRFLSLSTLAYLLTGDDQLTLPGAFNLWGIQDTGGGPSGLLGELRGLGTLFQGQLQDLDRWAQ